MIDTNVQSYATGSLVGTNYVFDLNNSGGVKDFDGSVWNALTGGTSVSQLAAVNGGLYMLAHNGGDNDSVWQYNGRGTSWTPLTGAGTNVSQLTAVNGSLYMLANNGGTISSVWQYGGWGTNWTPLTGADTRVSQIAAVSGGLYMLAHNGGGNDSVWQYNGWGTHWTPLTGAGTNVSQLTAVSGGLYMLANNGGTNSSVWQYGGWGTNWTPLTGANTQVFQIVAANDSLYMVGTNGGPASVWQYSIWSSGWTALTGPALQTALATWPLGTGHPAADAAYSPVSGTLFGASGPSYRDVQQGGLGDCWLMASLAEVAARMPSVITSMFIYDGTTMENGSLVSVYSVRFYSSSGVARYVTVDTELPAGGSYYDRPINGVLWVALAEKAYAEANAAGIVTTHNVGTNSYAVMGGGDPGWALQAITGQPASDYKLNPSDVASAWNQGKLVVLCTGTPSSSYIVGYHCYAVVGYNASDSQPFKVFNAWGTDSHGWAPGNPNTVYGLFTANGAFLSQNFTVESFAGASPSGAANHTLGLEGLADLVFALQRQHQA